MSALAHEPPNDLDAEDSVLGAAILAPQAIEACADLLNGPEFYRPSSCVIWQEILEMWRQNTPVDVVTLHAHLDASGHLTEAGGKERLHELALVVPATSNARHHAQRVRDLWLKRQIGQVLVKANEAAMNGMPPREVGERLEKFVLNLNGLIERGRQTAMQTSAELADQYRRELADPPSQQRGIATPFRTLRRLQGGRLYVLAGETAHGKTILGGQFTGAACKDGAAVGVFSIEMTRSQLFDRLIANYGIPLSQVEARRVGPVYEEPLEHALRETAKWRVEINDDRAANHATFRRWQRLRRYDLLVIDHLHEIDVGGRASEKRVNLEQELLRIATVARDLDVPILLLAQLSRGDGGRPTLARLRESGRIEQVAAQVMFVWRKKDDVGDPGTEAELIVAKDRFGPVGKLPLHFDGECVRFLEVVDEARA